MEGLYSGISLAFQKSMGVQKRTEAPSVDCEPARKRRLLSADSFSFSLEDVTNHLHKKHDIPKVHEEDSLYEDDFCFWCDARRYKESFKCPYHGNQPTNKKKEENQIKKPYAYQNIPNMLQLQRSQAPNGVMTRVCAVNDLPAGAWIGPYEGTWMETEHLPLNKNTYMWEIFKDGKLHGYIDGSDENKSSWMRFIRRARHQQEQNLWAFQYQDKIYYRVNKTITPGQELLVWYDHQYIHHAGIMPGKDSRIETKTGEQVQKVSHWAAPIKETIQQSKTDNARYIQMETTFNGIAALVTSPTKRTHPSTEFPRLSSGETTTTPSKPTPRVSTGFSLKITDSSFTGNSRRHLPAIHTLPNATAHSASEPISPSTPDSTFHRASEPISPSTPDSAFHRASEPISPCTPDSTFHRASEPISPSTPVSTTHSASQPISPSSPVSTTHSASQPISPSTPNSHDSGFSFDSGLTDSPSKSETNDENCIWRCGQCNKSFAQRAMLEVHVCGNVPFKPYKCGHCDRSFATSGQMRAHAVIHQGKKPFKCGYCARSFTGATTLNNHIRIHTGEKPFRCHKCRKTFSQGSQLSKHDKIPGDCVPIKN